MAESFDVHVVTFPLALTGATEVPLFQVPSSGGGITVLSAHLLGTSGTAVGGKLVTMSDAGTPAINGTVGAFAGTVTASATIPAALTISGSFVAAGYWIGYDQTSGTVTTAHVALAYVMGK